MKNGTPVIAFREGGPQETIINGKTGFLIKKNLINEFVKKAIFLIENKDVYEDFSKNCTAHIKKNYNFQEYLIRFEKILENLLNV